MRDFDVLIARNPQALRGGTSVELRQEGRGLRVSYAGWWLRPWL